MSNSKWVVKKQTNEGWVVISEHPTEKDARHFWRGHTGNKGEAEIVFEEKTSD